MPGLRREFPDRVHDGGRRARGLRHDCSQLVVDRAFLVRPEIDVAPFLRALEDAALGQPLQLALRLSDRQTGKIDNLPQVEGFIRM